MSWEQSPSLRTPSKKPSLPNVHIEGIGDSHEEAHLHTQIDRNFHEQNHPDLEAILKAERPKTREELEIIDFTNKASSALLKRYGATPFDIAPKQVHVIDAQLVPKSLEKLHGEFNARSFGIAVKGKQGSYPFAATTFHEMLHAKSRIGYVAYTNEKKYQVKRVGLQLNEKTRVRERKYFRWMNEAVTEELTIKFIERCRQAKLWKDEVETTEEWLTALKEHPDYEPHNEDGIYFIQPPTTKKSWFGKKPTNKSFIIESYAYLEERKMLSALIDFIYKQNPEQFQSREAVFDVFAQAMLTGTLLPLGRLIERTFQDPEVKNFRHLGNILSLEEFNHFMEGITEKLRLIRYRKDFR